MSMHWRNRRGAALVEFAVVVVLILTLLFGIIEFGLLIKDYLSINQAAREGARTAALGKTVADITSRVVDSSPAVVIGATDVSIYKSSTGTSGWTPLGNDKTGLSNDAASGDYIRVDVHTTHQWVTKFFFSTTTPMNARMIMRRE